MDTTKFLITSAQIAAMTGECKTHFLNPNAVRTNKSLGDAVGLSQIGVHMIYVEPGRDTTEYHIHHFEEECLFVMSGTASATIGETTHRIGPGDFLGFPRNTVAHNIINDGQETLVCLVMGQRLPHDVGDYPRQKKRLYRNNGQWNLVNYGDITDPKA